MQILASIPSPTHNVWHVGPLPIRAYALCIIVGILVAVWLATRRWVARGGNPDHVWDVAAWGIVLGIIGARLYHLATDPELYFEGKPGTSPVDAVKIWDGGLGIWGAIALGAAGVWIGCRRRYIRMAVFADAAAPGIVLAQGIGRVGNWFNNELYGRATSLPWGLTIHCLDGSTTNGSEVCVSGDTVARHFQPTFLYELIWDVAIAAILLLLDRRLRLGRGNVFALYAMGYTIGRAWIEYLRIDHANHFLGLRINDWTCLIVFLGALAWFLRHGGFHAQREPAAYRDGYGPHGPIGAGETGTGEIGTGAVGAEAAEPDKEVAADGEPDR